MDEQHQNNPTRGWVWTTISTIAEKANPGFPSGKHSKESKGIPHLRPMNISRQGDIDLSNLKYVQQSQYDRLLDGDVLFNNTNSPELLGKTARIPKDTEWAYSNHMTRIRLNKLLISPAWLANVLHYYFLTGFFRMNCTHHVNQASINTSFLCDKVLIPLPPFNEQHRIVAKIEELLTKLDAGIKALNEIKQQIKRYRQSVLKAAFEGRLTAEWRERHKAEIEPASALLARMKENRRTQFIERQRGILQSVISSRVRNSSASYSPQEVLIDFLVEVVTKNVDIAHHELIGSITTAFLHAVNEKIEPKALTKNYTQWLNDSLRALRNEGLESEVIKAQLIAWHKYIDEEINPYKPRRTYTPLLGAMHTMFDAFKEWLVTSSIDEKGVEYIRKRFLEEPAIKEWKNDEARRNKMEVDATWMPSLPESWIWTRVGEISVKMQYGTSEKATHDPSGIPVLRMGNIQDGKLDFTDLKYLPAGFPGLQDLTLVEGDILFNRTNSAELVGKTATYLASHPKATFASYLIRVRVNNQMFHPVILASFINSFHGKKYIASVVSQQVGQANVNGTKLSMMPIPLIPIGEQDEIVSEIEARFSVADIVEKTVEQSLTQSSRLRQSTLKRAFEGKLVPQDPSDEPAEKLLERIWMLKKETGKESSTTKNRRFARKRQIEGKT
jgi:restriction endonuclease S subunit